VPFFEILDQPQRALLKDVLALESLAPQDDGERAGRVGELHARLEKAEEIVLVFP
jgi:hypothetical protein